MKLWSAPISCLLLLGLLLSYPVSSRAESEDDLFERLDRNGDGQLTAVEMDARVRFLFFRLQRSVDRNHDQSLSRSEFDAGTVPQRAAPPRLMTVRDDSNAAEGASLAQRAPRLFRRFDANRDGKLSLDEVPKDRQEAFRRAQERLRINGGLTLPQFTRLLEARADAAAAPSPTTSLANRLRQFDRDGDQRLSRDEAPRRLREAFERFDRNRDGLLDAGELQDLSERLQERGRRDP